jgi:hypothetical protein
LLAVSNELAGRRLTVAAALVWGGALQHGCWTSFLSGSGSLTTPAVRFSFGANACAAPWTPETSEFVLYEGGLVVKVGV